ncbi:MAG: TIGR00299 family protein [Elusimicrobia bacterium RIFOXYD2_FULL_34_15]|nr:MAG: TIGR00299 family protein [Elusimicrobia bacterium RIFOXYD2_FULL_34_15]
MKIIYFDCSSGVAGDMILSSLIDAGLDEKYLINQLKKLDVAKFSIKFSNILKNGIHAKIAQIEGGEQLREIAKIKKVIKNSKLSEKIKKQGLEIYLTLARAESKAHSIPIDSVHFHQIAEIDTMIDVFGAVIALDTLKIDKVYSSPLNLGKPTPATIEIIKNLPVYSTDPKNELTTPTGAAIISTLTKYFGPIPYMKILQSGTGAGLANFEIPNILRAYIGEEEKRYFSNDKKIVLETNIDDMDPRIFPYIQEKLLKNGADDVWLTNIYAKKGRPGIILSVITTEKNEQKIADIIFLETTTLGIRRIPVSRWILNRRIKNIFKFANLKKSEKKSVEYEKAKNIAEEKNIPLKDIL